MSWCFYSLSLSLLSMVTRITMEAMETAVLQFFTIKLKFGFGTLTTRSLFGPMVEIHLKFFLNILLGNTAICSWQWNWSSLSLLAILITLITVLILLIVYQIVTWTVLDVVNLRTVMCIFQTENLQINQNNFQQNVRNNRSYKRDIQRTIRRVNPLNPMK